MRRISWIAIFLLLACSSKNGKNLPILNTSLLQTKTETISHFRNLLGGDSLVVGKNLTDVGYSPELYYYPKFNHSGFWIIYPQFHNNILYGFWLTYISEKYTQESVLSTIEFFNKNYGQPIETDSISGHRYDIRWQSDSVEVELRINQLKMGVRINHQRIEMNRIVSECMYNQFGDSWDFSYDQIDTNSFVTYLK